jgi:copper chaperone
MGGLIRKMLHLERRIRYDARRIYIFNTTFRRRSMATTTLKVQGMTCNHCVMRVAKALKAVPGVQDAKIDLQKAEATVSYDDAKVSPEKLAVTVVEAGYKVV